MFRPCGRPFLLAVQRSSRLRILCLRTADIQVRVDRSKDGLLVGCIECFKRGDGLVDGLTNGEFRFLGIGHIIRHSIAPRGGNMPRRTTFRCALSRRGQKSWYTEIVQRVALGALILVAESALVW